MTLLSMCQDVAAEVLIPKPSSITSNNTADGRLLLALANRGGYDLMKAHTWTELTKEATYTASGSTASDTVANVVGDSDYDRLIADTLWHRTDNEPMYIADAKMWQKLQSSTVATNTLNVIRRRGNNFLFEPALADGAQIAFEYISTEWAESSGGSAQTKFENDSDVTVLPERLHALDLKWRVLHAKGRAYAEAKSEFLAELIKEANKDGGNQTDNMFINDNELVGNIPDSITV